MQTVVARRRTWRWPPRPRAFSIAGLRWKTPASLAISDSVALPIAGIVRGETPWGRVLDRFYRNGVTDSDELIEAARTE